MRKQRACSLFLDIVKAGLAGCTTG
jgi:hypothetical protein